MNHDYFNGKGKGPLHQENDNESDNENASANAPRPDSASPPLGNSPSVRPNYMTVGNGTTSEHAARLQSMLDVDSGYGGSIAGDDQRAIASPAAWDMAMHHDRPASGAVHQMWYNAHRANLGRSINKVLELLQSLQEMNASWPAHYPSVQRARRDSSETSSRPSFSHAHSTMGEHSASSPSLRNPMLRRSMTSVEESTAESSRAAENRSTPEPRLVSPQIAQEFSILKLDLKLGALHQAELVHSLEKGSIASLLDGKISTSIKHLLSLRDRIEDTASKVLITGDLNAGKSTFCNALLRRKVLPEDQQPCTAIFCEVLDARENSGVEEVHAVHKKVAYDRNDESTYDVFPLQELERIVVDNETYTQCKIYVKDSRSIDESLLNNGVVDIALIDAPGLNSDTTKTTAIFARQEEIDVVVFVVSAANHFTQSAKEFIWAAAAEKAYIFIVVNGFDVIRDKKRCEKMVLDQVQGLSPRTHKESSELVHFVSSNAIPVGPSPPGGPGGSGSGSSSGGSGDPGDSDDKGKGKDREKIRDFEALEQSLRRFVLEKRARSKLAPARTYLLNILNDVQTLANVNQEVAQSELERVTQELKELEPQLESSRKARTEVSEHVDTNIEETCKEVYDHTRMALNSAIVHSASGNYDVPYPGILSAFQYAEDLKEAMLSRISDSVTNCEEYARGRTVRGVNSIKQLGLLHVGDEFQNLQFRPDVMFRRKKDALARQVHIPTELMDFVDWTTLLQRQEKYAGTGMALTVAGAVVPKMLGMNTWMDQALTATRLLSNENLRQLILPGILVAAVAASVYVLQQIPNSLPPRLATKISTQLNDLDYVHSNATRISSSVRKVLRFPADNLRVGLDQSVKDLGTKRDETIKVKGESERASRYFSNLVRQSEGERLKVESVDLDSPPAGAH
ncbi:Dynamin-type G domain-containing protein [Fusarium keratoplasticum]|uniref:Dynamin-type G domain-containing protein n=1 Tax=Fusarium keratoplasticum TaxID=1328300 RepID=A0ACC0QW85_9HYPO|nr:Dynamin-type G domain-containing protein [Fusarium keratoplasticum]KAI8666496.1 Dynamin-type G domain-containing protein [Fusarium keratoplasticum]